VLGECLSGALVEVDAAPTGARAEGSAAAPPPARRVGVGVVITIVGKRHFVVFWGMVSNIVEFFSGRNSGQMQFVMVDVGE